MVKQMSLILKPSIPLLLDLVYASFNLLAGSCRLFSVYCDILFLWAYTYWFICIYKIHI